MSAIYGDWRDERWYKYQGVSIVPCQHAGNPHGGRWRLIVHHKATGLPYSDDTSPHFVTLAQARESIRTDKLARSLS